MIVAIAGGKQVSEADFIRRIRYQKQAGPHRTEPEDRRGGFDVGVDIARVQGREDTEGCRVRGYR